jgi:hypothetical protein
MPFHRAFAITALLVTGTLAACGGGNDNGTGGQTTTATGGAGGQGGSFAEAQHAAFPAVVAAGGPVLASPKVQPILYASDPHLADVEGLLDELTKTTYWSETTSEYGVGPLTVLPTIKITDPPPTSLTDSELTAQLAMNTTGASPAWGAADKSTIYLFVLPKGTVIDAGGLCCQDYDGYHDEASAGGKSLPYAVVCTCHGLDGPNVDDVQQVTIAVSHELVEAATDPYVNTNPAWGETDAGDFIWTVATGGEVADMCEFNADSFVIPKGSKYMVQKSWSNAAAKAGKQPCLPAADGPSFGAAPVLPDKVSITGFSQKTAGVLVPKGQSKTIDVQLWSDEPTSKPMTITAYDLGSLYGSPTPDLKLTLDKTQGINGDTVKLTVELLKVDSMLGIDAFILEADMDGASTLYMGAVGTH